MSQLLSPPESKTRLVGAGVRRKEDPRLVRGEGRFVDDISAPGVCYAAFVRSPYAHASISSVDVSRAKALRGVVAVFTARHLLGERPKGIPTSTLPAGARQPQRYPLAVDEVKYVGEPVALVVAHERYVAKDAADLVEVVYEPSANVADPEEALRQGSPKVHKEFADNVVYRTSKSSGDVDGSFKRAAKVVSKKVIMGRMAPVALENRGIMASYALGDGSLTVWASTQIPHMIKTWYADYLGIPENRVRILTPDVGGGFGAKAQLFSDELAVVMASIKLGRPVKWVATRMEDLLATAHARGQVHDLELAMAKDGRVLALRDRIVADIGAYLHLFTLGNLLNTVSFITGAYDIRNVEVDAVGVFTNRMGIDAFRGAGIPEAHCAIEAVLDEAGRALKIDPAEIRLRNFVKPSQFPYTNVSDMVYDSGDYERALKKALDLAGYGALRRRQREGSRRGKRVGVGVASYVLVGGFGPSKLAPERMGGFESARVRVEPDGRVAVYTGTSPHGQGGETSLAQIAADELGVGIDDVVVLHGDTDSAPYGYGSQGSRAAAVGGESVVKACRKVREKAFVIAAHILGVGHERTRFEGGRFHVRGSPKSVTLAEVAKEAAFMKNVPAGTEPFLEAVAAYEPEGLTFSFGSHVAAIELDEETGRVGITAYVGVDDCGRAINPVIVEGQMQGGVAQGIAEAVYEELRYDENGQLLTSTLADYAVPSATEIPDMVFDRTETLASTYLGVKGIGEAGPTAGLAAVTNAVADALGSAAGEAVEVPLTSDRVWARLLAKNGMAKRV